MPSMVRFLSQFVLQMLPSIVATVIGAYIVATYINPKTPPDAARSAAAAQTRQAEKAKTDEAAAATDEQNASQPASVQPAENKPAEVVDKPKPVKAATAPTPAPTDVRIIPIVKPAAAATVPAGEAQNQASVPAEERKDANDLARAAIQRLRNPSETREASRQADERPAPAVRTPQQVRLAPEPQPATPAVLPASAPPLPPAINISAPRYPQAEDTATTASVRSDDRLTPPAEVPASGRPLDLRAANATGNPALAASGNPSIADDFLSATKSFIRAVMP